jgi:FixJ family two-component response regulator
VIHAEVLAEIATGLSNTEIAAKFVVSEATVKTHVGHLLAQDRDAGPRPAGRLRLPARPAQP